METVLDAPSTREHEYAGFWVRVLAFIIDAVILIVVKSIAGLFFGGMSTLGGGINWSFQTISFIIDVSYFAILESSDRQATVGKMAVGIKVVGENGERITFLNAVGRYLAKYVSAIILLIGFLMVAWDERKQGLHDKLARTFVIVG